MPKVTAAHVVDVLREHYGLVNSRLEMEEWALLTEVPLRGPGRTAYASHNERTIDVMLLRNWGGGKQGFERLAFEVKVSKADYKNETDDKREPAWVNAHRCAYVCPPGIIEVGQLPPGWGLAWVYPEPISDVAPTHRDFGKRLSWRKGCTLHEPTADPLRLMHTIARRASRAEERLRAGEDDPAALAALRVEADRLHARLANVDSRIERQRQKAREAMTRLRARGEQRCADCDGVVKASLNRRSHSYDAEGFWRHVDPAEAERCNLARSEQVRLAREAETGSRYSTRNLYAPQVETVEERAERLRDSAIDQAEQAAYNALTTEEDRREESRYA